VGSHGEAAQLCELTWLERLDLAKNHLLSLPPLFGLLSCLVVRFFMGWDGMGWDGMEEEVAVVVVVVEVVIVVVEAV